MWGLSLFFPEPTHFTTSIFLKIFLQRCSRHKIFRNFEVGHFISNYNNKVFFIGLHRHNYVCTCIYVYALYIYIYVCEYNKYICIRKIPCSEFWWLLLITNLIILKIFLSACLAHFCVLLPFSFLYQAFIFTQPSSVEASPHCVCGS